MIEISGGRAPLPRRTIEEIARAVVGARFSLSLAIVSPAEIKKHNAAHRAKDEPTDVLAFPFDANDGECLACPVMIAKKFAADIYPEYVTTPREAFAFAVIHSLLHLVGYDHGSTMERKERAHMRALAPLIHGETTTGGRNRHRHDDR